jgi:ArsR family transcriptional regulator, virulence genes transcriptional regulator
MNAAATKTPALARRMSSHAAAAADLLKSLAHPARLMVLCLLVDAERSAGELEAHLDLSQSALSQHLALLREAGLVNTRREAQSVYYQVAPGPWLEVLQVLQGHYCPPAPRKRA